jgi:PilZ domain
MPNFVAQDSTVDRKDPRLRVSREASIVLGGGRVNCRILDSSAGGALLELPYTEWLPPRFELEDSGVRRQVALVWQGSEHAGVRFLDKPPRHRPPAFGRRGRSPSGAV